MRNAFVLAAMLAATAVAIPAWSDDKADHPLVAYRHNMMESLGKHMRLSSMIMKGEVDRKADLLTHAVAIHDMSKGMPELFPADTAPPKVKSDSRPELWTKWDDFVAKSTEFEAASAKLVEVAKGGDMEAYTAQYKAVGKLCGDCHDSYRVDEK